MHRISVASDAPALVLAVPGPEPAGHQQPFGGAQVDPDLAEQIAEAAAESVAGAEIRIGYLAGRVEGLAAALTWDHEPEAGVAPQAVVVPLLACTHPHIDRQLAELMSRVSAPVMLAPHLGPHPLLAGALHDRLAEVGLARASRARGLNIAAGADGVLLIADRGPQAVSDAGVTAVLLAARLAVPVVPASIDDPTSVRAALERLREAGATHPAIAPCLIGPETDPIELGRLSAAIDAPCAPPLGAHPAIAQLVAVRYGEALARLSVPSR
jgi:sirohydrochlorin ferrochelatase